MSLPNSYTQKPGAVPAYFDAILDAQAPERFSAFEGNYAHLDHIPALADNRLALGSKGSPGTYGATVGEMVQFMVTQKLLSNPVAPDSMVTGDFLPAK